MFYWQHLFAYESVMAFCKGAKVLDVGCGSGYGAQRLGKVADSVLAIDVSKDAIDWANGHNMLSNVEYRCVSIQSPELAHQQFDVIVSFQVIEHIAPAELPHFLASFARLLAPNGVAFITTPNRLRRLPIFQQPWNPHHTIEYSPWSLKKALAEYFDSIDIRYISGNEHVMAAEWERGTQVTPIRYYGSGLLAGIVGRVAGAPLFAIPEWQSKVAQFVARAENKIGKQLTRRSVGQWNRTRPFELSDFQMTSEFDWWAIDLFAELRESRFSRAKFDSSKKKQ
jgi:SAM-dependent methyltransferase